VNGNDEQDGETPAQNGVNLGLVAGGVAAGLALVGLLVAFVLFKRRKSVRTEVEGEDDVPDVDTFHTEQFDGEDDLTADYTNPVYEGKGSDDFEDDLAEL
jgi:hypothetical protein